MPVTFTLTSTDPGAGVVYKVVDPVTFGAPANATVSINQTTGQVTLTPNAGFTGTINLLAEVRSSTADDVQANYNDRSVQPGGNSQRSQCADQLGCRPVEQHRHIRRQRLHQHQHAKARRNCRHWRHREFQAEWSSHRHRHGNCLRFRSVPIHRSGGEIGDRFQHHHRVGYNNTGGTSVDSTALTLIYAPDYNSGVYVVPGAPGSTQQVTMAWAVRKAKYNDEIGYFIADSLDGSVNGVAPGDPGYAQAALSDSSRHIIFAKGQTAGASSTITLQGGQIVVFYMIQNNTTGEFSVEESNSMRCTATAMAMHRWRSLASKLPIPMVKSTRKLSPIQRRAACNTTGKIFLRSGDSDFNDVVMTVRLANQSAKPPATVHAPGTGDKTVTVNGSLNAGHQQSTAGDLGVFFVDNPDGSIGTLKPGDTGYAAAALAAANSRVLFAAGSRRRQPARYRAGRQVPGLLHHFQRHHRQLPVDQCGQQHRQRPRGDVLVRRRQSRQRDSSKRMI